MAHNANAEETGSTMRDMTRNEHMFETDEN